MATVPNESQDKEGEDNLSIFVDCLTVAVAQRLSSGSDASAGAERKRRVGRGRKNHIKPVIRPEGRAREDAAAELGDFIEYLADEIFPSVPAEVRGLSYAAVREDPELGDRYATPLDKTVLEELTRPLPASVTDSLCSYALIEEAGDVDRFLGPVWAAYVASATAPPAEYTPALGQSRPDGCEICEREHLPLTYHHLIPRQVHTKAVKRGWHSEWELNKVAWLCRACHSYVHKIASNEQLARELYSVDLLLEREDVRKWATWVGRVRWKAR